MFPAGVTTVTLYDADRPEVGGEPRPLRTEIWYPAAASARQAPRDAYDFRAEAPPDVLALSAGASAALAAPPGTFARIATWSGAVDIWAAADNLARHPMPRWHYTQVIRRAFHQAHLPVPPLATIPSRLAAGAPCGLPPGPLLVVHAEDDPVVPASSVRALSVEDGQCVTVLPAGAHLGFGTLAGPDVYLVPFDEA